MTLQQLAELAVPFIGDGCMVDVRREDGTIERFALAAVDDELRDGFVRLHRHPIDPAGEHPIARAMRTGQSRSCRSRSTRRTARRGPARPSTSRTCGAFPGGSGWSLRSSRATGCSGTLSIALSPRRESFGDRESRSSRSSRAAPRPRSRTRACTPSAPTSPRRCSRACCRRACPPSTDSTSPRSTGPPPGGTEVGGDFYDVFETCGGGWGVAIADVCGKGVEAAAVTALTRHTLRAAALHHAGPAEMLETVNDALLLNFEGSQFCTVALGVVERDRAAPRA